MNDMVKEVFVAIRANTSATVAEAEAATRAAILAVLEFYSDPGNVTDKMADECACTPESLDDARDMVADAFRAAMRAARDEVSRDK